MMRTCVKCGIEDGLVVLEEHHVLPKFLGGTDKRRILLCKKCHDELHRLLGVSCKSITEAWLE